MITYEQAADAMQTIEDCNRLAKDEAFQSIVMDELKRLSKHHIEAGRDLTKDALKRAEHHHASHMADKLLTLLDDRKQSAENLLADWRKQQAHSEDYV